MLKSVFLKTLRDKLVPMAWWSGGLMLMSFWMVTLYPSIAGVTGFTDYIENLPDSMRALLGEVVSMDTLEGFLSVEMFGFFFPALTIAIAISFGGALIRREEDEGTLDLLLSYPVSRWRLVSEKFAALVVFILVVMVATYAGLALGAVSVDIEADYAAMLEGMAAMTVLTLLFVALPLFLTALKRGRGAAVGVSAGIAVVTYFLYTMQPMSDLPEWVRYLSPWYYYSGDSVLITGMTWWHPLLLLGVTAVLFGMALVIFQRRDLAT